MSNNRHWNVKYELSTKELKVRRKKMSMLKNNVRLTGFLGGDPEVRIFSDNKNMARVSLATNDRYRNADGDWITDTQWHNLVFWGKNAVFAEKALRKGAEISIGGRLVNRSYVDKEGATRYVTEVVVNETLLIQKRSSQQNHEETTGSKAPSESETEGFAEGIEDGIAPENE